MIYNQKQIFRLTLDVKVELFIKYRYSVRKNNKQVQINIVFKLFKNKKIIFDSEK